MVIASRLLAGLTVVCSIVGAANAGPPFLTDDPEPTPNKSYEIYLFAEANWARGGAEGSTGVDFNYGGGPDLQLTAAVPVVFEHPSGGDFSSGLGNIELAAKFRFLHQDSFGWDVAVFPRLFLPDDSALGDDHFAFLLPVWVGKDWDSWSTFGGGGCALNRGNDSRNYCIAGWALTHRFDQLMLGSELFYQSADTKDGFASTVLGVGGTYDVSDTFHVLGYAGAGLSHPAETGREVGYFSLQLTF